MARLGDVVKIEASSKSVVGDRFWLLNLDMVEQQTGNIIDYNYVGKDALNGSIIQFDTGCVLYSKLRPNLNKVVIPNQDGFATSEMLPLRPNTKMLTREYLTAFLRSDSFVTWAVSKTAGAKMPRLGSKELLGKEIPLPSISEQTRIAEQFDKVDELIALRKEQLAKLDQLVKSRFIELFGDPKLNDKGWDSGVVADYFDVKGGKRIPKGMGYSDKKTNHPYLRATDMKNETILEDDIHYIDEDVFQHIKRYTVKGGDIYLTNVGVNLGMAGVIPQKFDGASLTENAVKLVSKTEKVIDGVFLAHYINSPGIQEYINERKMSVGVPKLAIFRIETMPLLIPPMDIQQDFNTFVEQTDKSKLAIQQSLDKLETLKKSLMQEYFG